MFPFSISTSNQNCSQLHKGRAWTRGWLSPIQPLPSRAALTPVKSVTKCNFSVMGGNISFRAQGNSPQRLQIGTKSSNTMKVRESIMEAERKYWILSETAKELYRIFSGCKAWETPIQLSHKGCSSTEGPRLSWAFARETPLTMALQEGSPEDHHLCLKHAAACSSWRSITVHRGQTMLYMEDLGINTQTGLAAGISYFIFAYFLWMSERGYSGLICFLFFLLISFVK